MLKSYQFAVWILQVWPSYRSTNTKHKLTNYESKKQLDKLTKCWNQGRRLMNMKYTNLSISKPPKSPMKQRHRLFNRLTNRHKNLITAANFRRRRTSPAKPISETGRRRKPRTGFGGHGGRRVRWYQKLHWGRNEIMMFLGKIEFWWLSKVWFELRNDFSRCKGKVWLTLS